MDSTFHFFFLLRKEIRIPAITIIVVFIATATIIIAITIVTLKEEEFEVVVF